MAFLTDDQRRSYGTFTAVPNDGQLAGYFLLDREARRRAMACRGARSQLGTASSSAPCGRCGGAEGLAFCHFVRFSLRRCPWMRNARGHS